MNHTLPSRPQGSVWKRMVERLQEPEAVEDFKEIVFQTQHRAGTHRSSETDNMYKTAHAQIKSQCAGGEVGMKC